MRKELVQKALPLELDPRHIELGMYGCTLVNQALDLCALKQHQLNLLATIQCTVFHRGIAACRKEVTAFVGRAG